MIRSARQAGIVLKQTYAKEGKALRFQADGYAHARQSRRLQRVIKPQRTILDVVLHSGQLRDKRGNNLAIFWDTTGTLVDKNCPKKPKKRPYC